MLQVDSNNQTIINLEPSQEADDKLVLIKENIRRLTESLGDSSTLRDDDIAFLLNITTTEIIEFMSISEKANKKHDQLKEKKEELALSVNTSRYYAFFGLLATIGAIIYGGMETADYLKQDDKLGEGAYAAGAIGSLATFLIIIPQVKNIRVLQKNIEKLDREMNALASLKSKNEEIKTLKKELIDLSKKLMDKNPNLMKRLNDPVFRSICLTLLQENKTFKEKNGILEDKLKNVEKEIVSVGAELIECDSQLTETKANLSKKEKEITTLQKNLSTAHSQLKELKKQRPKGQTTSNEISNVDGMSSSVSKNNKKSGFNPSAQSN